VGRSGGGNLPVVGVHPIDALDLNCSVEATVDASERTEEAGV
jgi:hypothetical protein